MATLAIRKGNKPCYEIQFFDRTGDRRTIHLGGKHYAEKTARDLKEIVEILIFNRNNMIRVPDKRTAAYLETATPAILEKLGNVCLVERPTKHTCKELWDTFIEQKTDVKEATLQQYEHAKRRFFEHFKEAEPVASLTQDHFIEWRTSLKKTLKAAALLTKY